MTGRTKILLSAFFVASGFSGLLYQIVWVRAALADFGVITPFASVVVSVFMLGLGVGSLLGGRYARPIAQRLGVSALALYGATELCIGIGGLLVPRLFELGRAWLLPLGGMDSGAYLLASSLVISVAMLPWCAFMGATFPLMMAFVREREPEREDTFSFLYIANVIGAMLGAIATPLVLIEELGFARSISVAAALNASIAAACAVVVARRRGRGVVEAPAPGSTAPGALPRSPELPAIAPALAAGILFLTGFTSMALEIVWMRAFTPILGTLVYAFSGLLTVYLGATWLGSALYRAHARGGRVLRLDSLVMATTIAVLLPAFVAIPDILSTLNRFTLVATGPLLAPDPGRQAIVLTLASIAPFCACLGYVTPMLVDTLSRGDPDRAGRAYAINITGSIAGPLAAAYLLLPSIGPRWAMLVLAAPYALLFGGLALRGLRRPGVSHRALAAATLFVCSIAFVQAGLLGRSFEEGSHVKNPVVRRDHTATVISYGRGFGRHLIVNGHGMTVLGNLTKVMAHLPLASLPHPPERALVIAFGMGTTFRSLLSWDIEVTAVELVPSVVEAFDYYHADAAAVRADPKGRIVIDDGRRFLARTEERFDVITVDPPPPVETAGSSLLYAEEFLALVRERLAPGGILHHWFPDGIDVEPAIRHAVLRSVTRSFPHVRVYQSLHGRGLHLLCSDRPIAVPDAAAFVARLPPRARRDLEEWLPRGQTLETFLADTVLDKERSLESLAGPVEGPTITDDRPFNEYFALRRLFGTH